MNFKLIVLSASLFLLVACQEKQHQTSDIFGQAEIEEEATEYDLADIETSGELIAATLSGPDTYYEYHGKEMGLEYELAAAFARSIGTKLRMELYSDTTTLFQRLADGDIDMIALPLEQENIDSIGIMDINIVHSKWVVRTQSGELKTAINAWWQPHMRENFIALLKKQNLHRRTNSHQHAQPVVLSRERGVISRYDDLFKKYANFIDWDWRLLAAQCYQESAFDYQAVSWMGAQGLMQLMPETAREMGLRTDNVFNPASNIAAGTRYLKYLYKHFSDIPQDRERIRFTLAAYNGGEGHIRDAMSLAKKYGQSSTQWSSVEAFILRLSDPRYYRDACVKKGYMRGTETVDYVREITSRWLSYCRVAQPSKRRHSTKETLMLEADSLQ